MRTPIAGFVTVLGLASAAPGLADGDAARGEKAFGKCKACHMVGDGAENRAGPALNGVVDSPAGKVDGFRYSDNLLELAEGGLVWDDASLTAYLIAPKVAIPKGKKSFASLRKEEDIADVIAYLRSFE